MNVLCHYTASKEFGEDDRVTKAKFFIRDEFLVRNVI